MLQAQLKSTGGGGGGEVKANFTPVLEFGGGSTGITYVTQTGIYVRSGSLVTIIVVIELSSKGTDVGAATITGLPFASEQQTPLEYRVSSLTFDTIPQIRTQGSIIAFNQVASGGGISGMSDIAFANNTFFQIGGTYIIP